MRLLLDRDDLQARYRTFSIGTVRFKHFKRLVRIAITVIGRGSYYDGDTGHAKSIYPFKC